MDNPQYVKIGAELKKFRESFKPYYKWITLNTEANIDMINATRVLNLIING